MAGYIRNCLFIQREGESLPLIEFRDGSLESVHMDGYAIVPKEWFETLRDLGERAADQQAAAVIADAMVRS